MLAQNPYVIECFAQITTDDAQIAVIYNALIYVSPGATFLGTLVFENQCNKPDTLQNIQKTSLKTEQKF